MNAALTPLCPYCGGWSERVAGRDLYPHRADLFERTFYRCDPCDAHVGCHPGTGKPLGRLANAALRRAKSQAHAAFDPIWKNGAMSRSQAYSWLARQMALPKSECHIGDFDEGQCAAVVELCRRHPEHREASCPS
ncbi:zinc-finger-containing protein [Thioalkalivibrio sp. ALE16]|uniref:zinc-finger-containing protein n=1 Tax=Thioalkalivibrio sp. ALE16 TaxID=1158172 RepID=UPI000382A058|nr:zinc-finger-containing protein [Thioalkalivibrio sp. ALE16]